MIVFKSYENLILNAFFSCNVSDCEFEAEKLYATETSIFDVCLKHHKELTDKDYK
jgi:hypothetical protein